MAVNDPDPVVLVDARPITVVLKDIVGNLQHIIRAEIRLAQAEMRDEVSTALGSTSDAPGSSSTSS